MARWKVIDVPAGLEAISPNLRAFQADTEDGHLSVFVGPEPDGWHLSISHRSNLLGPDGNHIADRNPTWEELRDARYHFCPDEITMAMILPPQAEYVNLHETTFHLWQIEGSG